MEIDEAVESFLALIGFSMFFSLAFIGAMLASINLDSNMYVEFDPPEDFIYLMLLFFANFAFLIYFFILSFKFRESKNLNFRLGDLIVVSKKIKYYNAFYIPIQIIFGFFYIKYFETAIAIYMFILLVIETGLIAFVFYISYIVDKEKDFLGDE